MKVFYNCFCLGDSKNDLSHIIGIVQIILFFIQYLSYVIILDMIYIFLKDEPLEER
jgi:hypothetical protein